MIGTILFDRPEAAWLALAAVLTTLAMVLWGDQSVRHRAGWIGRSMIGGLRLLAFLSLSGALLQPVLSWTSAGLDRGIVAILIDQSGSMSAVDTQRPPSDLVAVAGALGELPSEARDAGLSRLRAVIEKAKSSHDAVARAISEVAYAKLAKLDTTAAAQRLSRLTLEAKNYRNSALDACTNVAGTNSIQLLLKSAVGGAVTPVTVDPLDESLAQLDQLQSETDQALFARRNDVREKCQTIGHSSRIALLDRGVRGSAGLIAQLSGTYRPMLFSCGSELQPLNASQPFTASGSSTNLISALGDLRRQLIGQRLAAIVLMTDGRQTESINQDVAGAGETPLFAVQVADLQVNDLAVSRFDHPSSVRVNEPCPVSVDVIARSMPNAQSLLTVTADDQTQTQTIQFTHPTTQASFEFSFEHTGVADVMASLEAQPGEATDRNNSLSSAIQVTGDINRVCLIDGVTDDTTKVLHDALSHFPGVQARVFDTSTGPTISDLSAADTIILHEVPSAGLSDAVWASIHQRVSVRGANLLIISDSEDLFSDYQESPVIRPLLSWSDEQSPSLHRSWSADSASIHILPQDRAAAGSFRVDDQPDQNRFAWRNLPPLSQVLTLPPPQSGSHALLIESESRAPVMTETWLGTGRVLILGCDEFWRWSNATNPSGLFERRLIDSAAGPGYLADDGELSLDVDHPLLSTEQPLVIRTRIRDSTDSELDDVEEPPLLRVSQGGKVVTSWKLDAPVDRSNCRAQFRSPYLSRGKYTIEFSWGRHYLSMNVAVVDPIDAEMRNVSGDDALLLNLIGSNGSLLKLKDLPSLKAHIDAVTSPAPVVSLYRLWDSPYLFLFVVGCLGLEWSLRNRWGLP